MLNWEAALLRSVKAVTVGEGHTPAEGLKMSRFKQARLRDGQRQSGMMVSPEKEQHRWATQFLRDFTALEEAGRPVKDLTDFVRQRAHGRSELLDSANGANQGFIVRRLVLLLRKVLGLPGIEATQQDQEMLSDIVSQATPATLLRRRPSSLVC